MIPTITPNNPKALPKISTTKILTNESGFWASAMAQPLPDTPTQILHIILFLPAKQVWNTYWNTCPENWISTEHNIVWVLEISFRAWCWQYCNFSLQNDGHNDSVNSDGFTEDNAKLWEDIPDKIFRSNTRSFHSSSEDTCSCNENTPKIIEKNTKQLQ